MSNQKRSGNVPNMGNLLNLERIPALSPKFANQIGKTCDGFRISYGGSGTTVEVASFISADGRAFSVKDGKQQSTWIGLTEWERRRALHNQPSEAEKLQSLKRKYELRLAKEFPPNGPASGKDEDIQAWLGKLPFAQRRALLMSQKDFSKSYPEGFRDS
jgi:hypothetical protein